MAGSICEARGVLMRRPSRRGLGWLLGSGCFCDSAIGQITTGGGTACWTAFPCTSASDNNPMSNVGPAASAASVAALQDAWAQTDNSCDANPLGPDCGCSSTIITSPVAVCDWIIYSCGAVVAGLLLMAMMGARR